MHLARATPVDLLGGWEMVLAWVVALALIGWVNWHWLLVDSRRHRRLTKPIGGTSTVTGASDQP